MQTKSNLDSTSMAFLREQARQAGAEEARWIFEHHKHADTAALEASSAFSFDQPVHRKTTFTQSRWSPLMAPILSFDPCRAAGNALDRPLRLPGGRRLRADSVLRRARSVPIATLR